MIRRLLACSLLLGVLLGNGAQATPVESFDDITFWVGTGANRAALAVDWEGELTTDTALVWGYRWNGTATGEDLLRAVAAEDDRFFAKLDPTFGIGTAVYGLGYDQNDDGAFAIDDGSLFLDGVTETNDPDDAVAAIDADDLYVEAWSSGYWHYAISATGPAAWASSSSGPAGRLLTDGAWESYATATNLDHDQFAVNLVAALGPNLPGDFNHDGQVDAADYTMWRDTLGSPEAYGLWVAHFDSAEPATTVPEPMALWLVVGLAGRLAHRYRPPSLRKANPYFFPTI